MNQSSYLKGGVQKLFNFEDPNTKEYFTFREIPLKKKIVTQKSLVLEKGVFLYDIYEMIIMKLFFEKRHPIFAKSAHFQSESNFIFVKSAEGITFLSKVILKPLETNLRLKTGKKKFAELKAKISKEETCSLVTFSDFPDMFRKLIIFAEKTTGSIPHEISEKLLLPENAGFFDRNRKCGCLFHNTQEENFYQKSVLRVIEECCLFQPSEIDMKFHFMKVRKLDLASNFLNSSSNVIYSVAYITGEKEEIIYETEAEKNTFPLNKTEELMQRLKKFENNMKETEELLNKLKSLETSKKLIEEKQGINKYFC